MKLYCNQSDHQWDGCRCQKCDMVRDQGHAYQWDGRCTMLCKRCRRSLQLAHRLDGCTCMICRITQHDWQDGLCARCRVACAHPSSKPSWRIIQDQDAAYAVKGDYCEICNKQLTLICKSPKHPMSAGEQTAPNRPRQLDPTQMAVNPLWQEVRACWQSVLQGDPEENWTTRGLLHREALCALVSLRELDADAKHGIQLAFDESVYHIERNKATCYMMIPPEWTWRCDLGRQCFVLQDMAQRSAIDPRVVRIARNCIAKDIKRLHLSHLFKMCDDSMNYLGAARVMAALFSSPPVTSQPS